MSLPNPSETSAESTHAAPVSVNPIEPDYSRPLWQIKDFAGRADFPECVLGEHIDISGFQGVVVVVSRNSIRVRSTEGITQSFNVNRLRTLFAPPVRIEAPVFESAPAVDPESAPRPVFRRQPEPEEDEKPAAPAPAPVREVVENPDFTQPVLGIRDLVNRADFPKCAFGLQVEINGFTGVVVEIVKQSLRVRSSEGGLQSYNGPALKKLHGRA